MPCRSLAHARSLLPPPTSSLPRCHHCRSIRPLLPHRLGVVILSSRLRVMSSPPLAPPYLSRNGEGIRSDCVMLGYSAVVACLSHVVSPPRAIWLGRSHPVPVVISCGLAASHVPTAGACGAVRSLRLLPHLSVSIVFKMFPCQCFKTLRLFGMALLCGCRGRPFYCLAAPSPSHLDHL